MFEKEILAQTVAGENEDRIGGKPHDAKALRGKPDLMLWQAITMSLVAILAVAVGTIYGTILF